LTTPDNALKALMEYPRVQDILSALQKSRYGAHSIIFVLANGVAVRIEAQAPRPSSQGLATQLFVSIYLPDPVRLNSRTGDEDNRRLWDVRKRIFEGFTDSCTTNALASAAGWTIYPPMRTADKSVLWANGQPHNLEIGVGEFDSWLSVELPIHPENYRAWLSYFFEVHLENGLFAFQLSV